MRRRKERGKAKQTGAQIPKKQSKDARRGGFRVRDKGKVAGRKAPKRGRGATRAHARETASARRGVAGADGWIQQWQPGGRERIRGF
jgi:hypothetical protein